jgi:hypothetical protein
MVITGTEPHPGSRNVIAARGRPTEPIHTDPQRYVIALARGLMQLGVSQRKAFDLTAALEVGQAAAPPTCMP